MLSHINTFISGQQQQQEQYALFYLIIKCQHQQQ